MNTHATTLTAPAERGGLLQRVLATTDSLSPVIARATLAVVLFPHGAQKLLGWFGGYGFEGTKGFFTETIGLPAFLAVAIILLEFFGPFLLLAGAAVRPVALAFAGVMVGAIATVHGQYGFLMNWSGTQAGEGFQFHVLVIALALVVALQGAGRWSIDRWAARG